MNKISTSYLLWMLGFLGFSGVHRLYNRKIFTGLLWFFTFGLFGIGQFIDLFIIPGMVDEYNARFMFRRIFYKARRHGHFRVGSPSDVFDAVNLHVEDEESADQQRRGRSGEGDRQNRLMLELLRAAEQRGGKLSVTQGVMDTGESFSKVEATLREMAKSGYIAVHNDPVSGVVMFDFIELGTSDTSPVHKTVQAF
jgi:TM2 domain-containing membrane protein YozV